VQFIDVRDLAEWMIRLAEKRRTGMFHATGPASPLTMGDLLEVCRAESGSDARFVWRDDESLLAAGLMPWRDLPLWIPESDTSMRGFMSFDCGRAFAAGLRFRPLVDTVRDTRLWAATRPDEPRRAGITRERERELLAAAPNPRTAEAPSG
jgi:2'-hydroxyisoflavone reductase